MGSELLQKIITISTHLGTKTQAGTYLAGSERTNFILAGLYFLTLKLTKGKSECQFPKHQIQRTKILTYVSRQTPNFFIEYLTQNVIFQVKSHVTKHEF